MSLVTAAIAHRCPEQGARSVSTLVCVLVCLRCEIVQVVTVLSVKSNIRQRKFFISLSSLHKQFRQFGAFISGYLSKSAVLLCQYENKRYT